MAKKLYTSVDTTIDYGTGEIKESTKRMVQTTTVEHFMKVYLNFLTGELNLKDYEKSFIMELFPRVGYETNKFTLLLDDKQEIATKLGKSVSHINNTITALKKSNVLVVVSRGKYMLNPTYFFRGDEIVRGKVLEVYKQFIIK